MDNRSLKIFKKQKRFLLAIGLVAAFGFAALSGVFERKALKKPVQKQKKIDLPIDAIDEQDLWMSRLEKNDKDIEGRLKSLEEMIVALKREESLKDKENENLRREIFNLRNELVASKKSGVEISSQERGSSLKGSPFSSEGSGGESSINSRPPLQVVSMGSLGKNKVKHVDEVIPSGVSVQAVLVSSLDAPCGVNSSSDPYPVKLRILDDASLPGDVRVHLKGGIIIATAYGNLSSERVFLRIERITQTKPSGEFVETEVVGFVSGEDGKYGLRGNVVDRSHELVKNAAISGVFQGITQYLQASVNSQNLASYSPNVYNTPSSWEIMQNSGMQGGASAMAKLSDYYIKRAEQLQPVIQVEAGRVVDITFTKGTEVGDIHIKEHLKKARTQGRSEDRD